jgi:enolase
MSEIASLQAWEILDSRGNPTVAVVAKLRSGAEGTAKVPSGASTGKREALELRDGDKKRYQGKGVLRACAFVEGEIAMGLAGFDATDQREVDAKLCQLDGTPNKGRLGANAILGVSLAVARAAAAAKQLPLYESLAEQESYILPTPMLNLLNGGKHADSSVDFQEFMVAPVGAPSFRDAVRGASEVFHSLKAILHAKNYSTAVGDEGGFAPELRSNEEALELLLEAIQQAGYKPGQEFALMLDPAASELMDNDAYCFEKSGGPSKRSSAMIELWESWLAKYPEIWSLEDGMAEEDIQGWQELTRRAGSRIQLVGDDNFVTNPAIFRRGIEDGIANAILIKLNQIGTLTETLDCIQMARDHNYGIVISHRSGETDDTTIADLAVASGAGQINTGSVSRGERVAKYNRLLEIERELGPRAVYAGAGPYARWKPGNTQRAAGVGSALAHEHP